MLARWLVTGVALAVCIGSATVGAQRQRPLSPLPAEGLGVAPFFDGWYENADGSITFSFGYSNLSREDVVEIPLGPDNFVTPKEYDGRQPTSFPPAIADSAEGVQRRPDNRRERERGVFTITVPPTFKGDVVWTLRHRGQTLKVPARAKTSAYQLRWPMAMGSVPPLLRFSEKGQAGRGPVGIHAEPMKATIGTPLALSVSLVDDSVREKEPFAIKERERSKGGAINVTWYKHSGPGPVEFSPRKQPIAELQGVAKTSATFKEAGEYMLRVRADNFGRIDTSAGNQCCWTNGYVKVTVVP